jgi:hypothetical protein
MTTFGILTSPTEYSMPPTELGQCAEAHGFDSIWFAEHSHIPTNRQTPFHGGGELPEYYKDFFDPIVGLTAAATVTSKLNSEWESVSFQSIMRSIWRRPLLGSRFERSFHFRNRRRLKCRRDGRSRSSLQGSLESHARKSAGDEGDLDSRYRRVSRKIRRLRSNVVSAQTDSERRAPCSAWCAIKVGARSCGAILRWLDPAGPGKSVCSST